MISRREVEAGDLASVLSRLKVFLATRQDAWLYRGQMTLVVDGYNNDPRELVDIPEVRNLLRGLESSWPQWAYFFNQVDDSIKLLLSCVAGSRFLGRGAVEMDARLAAQFAVSQPAALNAPAGTPPTRRSNAPTVHAMIRPQRCSVRRARRSAASSCRCVPPRC